MEEVFEFIKKCGTYYLATVEDDPPRNRPFIKVKVFHHLIKMLNQFLKL